MSTADILRQQGVDVRLVMKAARDDNQHKRAGGGAMVGAGGVAAAGGFAGGGVPGLKSDRLLMDVTGAANRREKVKMAARAYKGGEFGYRTNAHHTHQAFNLSDTKAAPDASRVAHLKAAHNAGQSAAETKIIRHLKVARKGSHAALVGGAGLTALGVHRIRQAKKNKAQPVSKAEKKGDTAFGAALGAGAATAGVSVGGARALEHHGRKWSRSAAADLDEAHKIIPNSGGHKVNPFPGKTNPRVPDIGPEKGESKVWRDPKILAGKSKAQAAKVGELRGNAMKSRYFAGVYGKMGGAVRRIRNPAIGVATVGAGGLAVTHHKKKDKVAKSLFELRVESMHPKAQSARG